MDLPENEQAVLLLIRDSWQITPERAAAAHGLDVAAYEDIFLTLAEKNLISLEKIEGEIVAATLTENGQKHLRD